MDAVAPDAKPPPGPDDPDDAAALARYARALGDAVDVALVGWVEQAVAQRWEQCHSAPPPAAVAAAARAAGERARSEVLPQLRTLLATDVDAQRANPLALLRQAVAHPTTVLADAGVPPVERDPQAEQLFPDDLYDLTIATFGDLHPSVHEPGLVWGAAKAHVILRRRRG
ncbi:MAG: hypothetical protein ACSLFP_08910 [Acidimicrobiales bacterium]